MDTGVIVDPITKKVTGVKKKKNYKKEKKKKKEINQKEKKLIKKSTWSTLGRVVSCDFFFVHEDILYS